MIGALLAVALTATHVDVVVSAGHEGRPASCAAHPRRACNLGTSGEREWTPLVADEAARVLRAHGLSVARLSADFDGRYDTGAAVFIHFDGSAVPCSSGASIGYHRPADARAAEQWRALYRQYIPFGFRPDNFTVGLRDYYAFRQVDARNGALVLELGELTCPAQRAWLAPRLRWEGDLVAYYLSRLIGKGQVPAPL
ncbi:MAG TPA: hypothetical protein VGN11_11620 [Candidatus Baltobacteraceae bacterium]|jgi:hypothetical protein|nr:hypothetical protein [Candidatus Baltobacteraceae bacterium]